jgi:cobalt/nickel transport system permease protein
MGANILNMGLLTSSIGYGLYRSVLHRGRGLKLAVAGLAAWLSVVAGALATSLEIWLSGNARLEIIVPTMLAWHALIGLGEALITVAALSFILRTRPDVLGEDSPSARGGRGWAVAGTLIALSVAMLSPWASANPDGLIRVARDLGFIGSAESGSGPLAGYGVPALGATPLSKIAAAVIGVLAVLLTAFLIGRAVRKNSSPEDPKP